MRLPLEPLPVRTFLWLVVVVSLAVHVRLAGTAWDGFAGLHPDERHLLFVVQDMLRALSDPSHAGLSLSDWLWSDASPLNPHAGERSYVYGEFPLLMALAKAASTATTDWFAVMAQARVLSALADGLTVAAVFLGARLLAGARAALLAAVLYAAMPTALQLANFFTVDVWQGPPTAAALAAMIALAMRRGNPLLVGALAGGFLGLALAAKITAALLVVPLALALAEGMRQGMARRDGAGAVLAALLGCALVFRLANPFAFAGPGILSFTLSPDWLADFGGLAQVTASPDFPPNWQWIAGYGILRFLRDLALFGAGPVASLLLIVLFLWHPGRWGPLVVPLSAFALYLLVAAFSSVSALRYAAPGLPALAMALAVVLRPAGPATAFVSLAVALWWGAGVVRLHDGQHPRLAASHWIWSLPEGTVIANETAWDESLPAIIRRSADEGFLWPSDRLRYLDLDITQPDTAEKADRIARVLGEADFLVLSSDRQSAVMPRLSDRFPMTAEHYRALFAGDACFALTMTIDRGFPLPGLRLDDGWAQEPWRVYDHPVVRIFRREDCFDADAYARRLKAFVPPS